MRAARIVLVPAFVLACGGTETNSEAPPAEGSASTAPATCDALFGLPGPATGLDETQCRPECACLGGWSPPVYDAAAIDALASRVLLDPPAELAADPYATPEQFVPSPTQVCAVILESDGYGLGTFDSVAEAESAGATVTHAGACGVCSPLQDLAVYMRNDDLTTPVRACGVKAITEGEEANLACLLELGFTLPCAQIWLHNTTNTRTACLQVCLDALDEPYHLPDGSLNACLQCDEDQSGAVFKAVAGRTRRNTGLASALCRPCDEVLPIDHVYE